MIRSRRGRLAPVIVLLLSGALLDPLSGKIDEAAFKRIVAGKTTEAEVLRLLGKPASVNANADGSRELLYKESKYLPPMLSIRIAANGVVASYRRTEFNSSLSALKGRKLDPAVMDRIREGETKEGEVERLLGKPQMKVTNSDGSKMYSYVFGDMLRGGSTESRMIAIDATGVVASVLGTGGQMAGIKSLTKAKPIDEARWAMIQEGNTTEKDVLDLLGEPTNKMHGPGASSVYMYMGATTGVYVVGFDSQGVVGTANRYGSGFGGKFDPDKWRTITPGATAEADVIELIGQPGTRIPLAGGRKAYLYYCFQGSSFSSAVDVHLVSFDLRGVVTSTDRYEDLNLAGLQVGVLDADLAARWEKIRQEKPDAAKVRELVNDPAYRVQTSDSGEQYLYLYKSGPDKVAAYLVGFEADRRTKEVRESVWKLREMNEAGHRINRAILDGVPLVKIGGTELAARLGEPQFRLGQRDGSSHWIYVFGQDNLSLMAFGNEAFKQAIKQRFGGCRIVVDSAGVVQSFEIF